MDASMPITNETVISMSVLGDQPYPSFELGNILRYLDLHHIGESEHLLAHIELSQRDLEEPFLPAYKVLEAFKYCAQKFGPSLGAKIGCTYHVNDLGVFGYAIASCKDLRQALHMADKYRPLIGNVLKRCLVETNETLQAKLFNVQKIDADALAFFAALSTSARQAIARSLFGEDFTYHHVEFDFDDSKNASEYQSVFGCPVKFNCKHNSWTLHKYDLCRVRHQEQNSQLENYIPFMNELIDGLKQQDSLVNEIQHILISCAGDYPDIEMLASAFNISSRTLRRQLSSLGTSYQKILNKVRCQLSIEYLTQTEISIEDISNLIGFSDVTNFRHAFRKWVGATPSSYRKTYQGQPLAENLS